MHQPGLLALQPPNESNLPPHPVTVAAPAGAYISLGYSLCSLVGGQLSKEFRIEQPGAFNFLFGIFGACIEESERPVSQVALPPATQGVCPCCPGVQAGQCVKQHQSATRLAGFPMGLTLCVVAGADLFTSNCMYATIAVAEGAC